MSSNTESKQLRFEEAVPYRLVVLISLVPLIGWIVLLVFHVQDSTPGTNRYGPNSKSANVL
jgi:uncharacterized membrane protein YhaH (DUF805 family)